MKERPRIVDTIKVFSNRFLTVVLSKIQSKIISSDSESSDWENSKNEIGNLIIDLDASINQSRKKGTAVEKDFSNRFDFFYSKWRSNIINSY